jgi:hypothetical protein
MTYRILFLAGLFFFLTGQVLLAFGNEFVYSLRPIDFAHWSLFLGAFLMIPQIVSFPKSIFSGIGIPMALVGAACTFGMCVLDFIWWSYPDEDSRIEFSKHISNVPAIWKPFISIGPSSKVFNLGLAILSLNYFDRSKVGVAIVVIATLVLMHIIPVPYRLVVGYTVTLIGFGMIFLPSKTRESI